MSKVLTTATTIIALGPAATGAAPAFATNYHVYRPWAHIQTQDIYPGYAESHELWPWYVPSHGIVGESCGDAFQPICNSERVNN
jgi:hypothetical protein